MHCSSPSVYIQVKIKGSGRLSGKRFRPHSIQLAADFQQVLRQTDLDGFITLLKAIFATILASYSCHKKPTILSSGIDDKILSGKPQAKFYHLCQPQVYHSIVYLTLRLLGFTVYAERMTNIGRVDAVLEMTDVVYILEFKMSTGQVALEQIRKMKYADPYLGGKKTVILIGIAFDRESRTIEDWMHEVVAPKNA